MNKTLFESIQENLIGVPKGYKLNVVFYKTKQDNGKISYDMNVEVMSKRSDTVHKLIPINPNREFKEINQEIIEAISELEDELGEE